MTEKLFPAPPINPEAAPFYEAAREGRFVIRTCTSCHKPHWYPRSICPFCMGDTEWIEASGDGVIYTYSVVRRPEPGFAIAYVTLAEGPTMMTNLVDCDFNNLKIGQRVKLAFKPTDGGPPIPCFTPV